MKGFVIALAALSCALCGCQSKPQERANLGFSVQTYHQHLRWGRYQQAASFLVPEERNAFLGRHDELGDDYKVMNVEIRHLAPEADPNEASAEVIIEWVREPDMVVHKDKRTQTWVLREGAWLLERDEVEAIKPRKAP
jgi:hypothetical protein